MNKVNSRSVRCKRKVRERLRYTSKKHIFAVRISNKNIYVLIMCSKTRNVLTQVSTLTPEFKKDLKSSNINKEVAQKLGKFAADHAKAKGFENSFAFDRGDRRFVGRVKEVIDSARENGLKESGDNDVK